MRYLDHTWGLGGIWAIKILPLLPAGMGVWGRAGEGVGGWVGGGDVLRWVRDVPFWWLHDLNVLNQRPEAPKTEKWLHFQTYPHADREKLKFFYTPHYTQLSSSNV